MFQWSIYSYSNIDGQAKQTHKEFNSLQEYIDCMRWNSRHASRNTLDDRCLSNNYYHRLKSVGDDLDISLGKYKDTLQTIEQDKRQQRKKIHMLKSLKTTLEAYKKEFEDHNEKELVKNVTADIKKVDAELKSLGFDGSSQSETSSTKSEETLSAPKKPRKSTAKTSAKTTSAKKADK